MLIESGASVNLANDHGNTPLIVALHNGQNAVAMQLLDKGASVNAVAIDGHTALLEVLLRAVSKLDPSHVGKSVFDDVFMKADATPADWQVAATPLERASQFRLAARLVEKHGASLAHVIDLTRDVDRNRTRYEDLLVDFASTIDPACLAILADTILPLLRDGHPFVRTAALRILSHVKVATLVGRATTIIWTLIRLNRTYTGVLQPLRAHLLSIDMFLTRRKFMREIAALRRDQVDFVRGAAVNCIQKHLGWPGMRVWTTPNDDALIAAFQGLRV